MLKKTLFVLCVVLNLMPSFAWAQFNDVGDQFDIHNFNANTYIGNGSSGADFNQDGWDDITTASGGSLPRFFQSNNGVLTEVFFPINIESGPSVISVQWIDYDGDGDLDLFFDQYGGRLYLYQNDGNLNFTDVTVASGLGTQPANYYGTSWSDYDRDGDLDVFISKYYLFPVNPNSTMSSKLHRNNGNGTFTDVTIASGLQYIASPTFQGTWLDFDADGWQDLYIIIDRESYRNRLYHNQQNGTFLEVAIDTGLDLSIDAMSITPGDFDRDDDMDIFVANGVQGNYLMQNDGTAHFTNIGSEAGVLVNAICWGSNWIDHNNDAWEDLFVSANYGNYGQYPNYFFTQNGTLPFNLSSAALGFGNDNNPTFCSTLSDWNNDGYFDFYNNNNDPFESDFWENQGGNNHWIGVKLKGTASNSFAVGSNIKLWTNGVVQNRYTHIGESYLSQHSYSEIFGLGGLDHIDSLEIYWPNGLVEHYENLPIDQYITLEEGATLNRTPIASTFILCENDLAILNAGDALSVEWNTGETTSNIEVDEPGEFWFTAHHIGGFTIYSDTISIEASIPLNIEPIYTPVICAGSQTGRIEIPLDPSVANVAWSNDETGNVIDELSIGFYSCIITKVDGCTEERSFSIDYSEPIESFTVNVTNGLCPGQNNGNVELIEVIGGNPPYTANYPENNGSLEAGKYMLTFSDAIGCLSYYPFTISYPEPITVEFELSNPTCFGANDGSIAITEISGGNPPYAWEWDITDISNLNAGDYHLTIYDQFGCTSNETVQLIEPSPLTVTSNILNEIENEHLGSIELIVEGGTSPYFYQWATGQTSSSISELNNGEFSVVITDMNGCTVESTFIIEFITSVQETGQSEISLSIFPNPATEKINWSSEERVEELEVLDENGRIIIVEKPNSISGIVTLGDYSNGKYLLRIKTKKGGETTRPFNIVH